MNAIHELDATLPAWMERFGQAGGEDDRLRQEIAEAGIALIARSGADGLTFRRLASTLDVSTSVITRLFGARDALWITIYYTTILRTQARIRSAYTRSHGSPLACLLAQMPVTKEGREDWHVYLAHMQAAASHQKFNREEREQVRIAIRDFAELLAREHSFSRQAARKAARQSFTFLIGVAVQAMYDPRSWSSQKQEIFMREQMVSNGIPI